MGRHPQYSSDGWWVIDFVQATDNPVRWLILRSCEINSLLMIIPYASGMTFVKEDGLVVEVI